MSESSRIMAEVSFNILYLIGIWSLVGLMYRHRARVLVDDQQLAGYFRVAFLLLAIGDTGHVGFRVWAYAIGGLESTVTFLGQTAPLVGLGALATAYTVTVFYMYIVAIWKVRFNEKVMGAYIGFQVIGLIRLLIMLMPQNEWASVVPPSQWSLYRNIPLMVVGIGVATHLLMSNRKVKDPFINRIALCIYISYLFYIPVILWVSKLPMLGMLMIPKTLAYVAIAVFAYRRYYRKVATDPLS